MKCFHQYPGARYLTDPGLQVMHDGFELGFRRGAFLPGFQYDEAYARIGLLERIDDIVTGNCQHIPDTRCALGHLRRLRHDGFGTFDGGRIR